MSIQRKRSKIRGDISSDLQDLRMEELDSSVQPSLNMNLKLNYADMLKSSSNRFMSDDSDFTDYVIVFTPLASMAKISLSLRK